MTGEDPWDPDQYLRFKAERSAPFHDLVELVTPVTAPRVVDLGCGTGELTASLHGQWDGAQTLGIDNSAAMLEQAAGFAGNELSFAVGDIADFPHGLSVRDAEGPWDVVFSNAAMQWVPDHPGVLSRWSQCLAPEGQLAVQVPANSDHVSHRMADEVAHEPRFMEAFGGEPPPDPVRESVLAPEVYAQLLDDLDFRHQTVRLQVYGHHLASSGDVVEWVKGTTLNRYRRLLSPNDFDAFVDRYRSHLLETIGDQAPYFYAFKRILMWARR